MSCTLLELFSMAYGFSVFLKERQRCLQCHSVTPFSPLAASMQVAHLPYQYSVLEWDHRPFLLPGNKEDFLPVNTTACWLMAKSPSCLAQSCISHWNIRRIHLWFRMLLWLICRVSNNPSEHSVQCAAVLAWGGQHPLDTPAANWMCQSLWAGAKVWIR